jgi:hypothetical protein
MDAVEADHLVRLVRANIWIPAIAVIVGIIIRLAKSDPAVAWIKIYIPPERRALWAMGLAIAGAAAERLATGGTWYDAIAGGLVAGSGAIAGHEIIVDTLRKGRDIGIKKAPPPPPPPSVPPPDWADDSLRPPAKPTIVPVTWTKMVAGVAVALALAACVGARAAVCPVIDLASTLCPLILVKMPDGTQEVVPRDRIAETAMRVRAARMSGAADAAREQRTLDRIPELERDGGAH